MLSTPQPPISIGIAILVVPVGIFVGTWIVAGIAQRSLATTGRAPVPSLRSEE